MSAAAAPTRLIRVGALVCVGLLVLAVSAPGRAGYRAALEDAWLDPYRTTADLLVRTALESRLAWDRLAELTDTFGPRLSGSANLERAIAWAVDQMQRDGFDHVRQQPVLVPHWVRGHEEARLVQPAGQRLAMVGLGGSIGTPPDGLEAEVLVVRSFSELEAKSEQARGRLVVFNAPITTYDETVSYRVSGASVAARHGAVATLVRSIGPPGLRTPHTGALQYAAGTPRIPAAAIAAEDAELLQRLQQRGARTVVRLVMGAETRPDAPSANVIGEILGRELPHEIVLVGGHFDSWDVGTGASDDAVGCIVTWEAVRLMNVLGIRPRRTVRVVLWTNEENGLRGADAYRDAYLGEAANHVLAVEADSGVFAPVRLGFSGPERARRTIEAIARLAAGLDIRRVGPVGGGADIGPIVQAGRVPALSLHGDPTRYFAIHHTPADTIDRLTPDEVSRAVAALAVVVYVVAEIPERL